jgi:glyceraldehyde-3-phosphate dehydrogenase (NAD(P))
MEIPNDGAGLSPVNLSQVLKRKIMASRKKIRVAVNGYGVIGECVADAVAKQNEMQLAGVANLAADRRPRVAVSRGMPLFSAAAKHAEAMREAGQGLGTWR